MSIERFPQTLFLQPVLTFADAERQGRMLVEYLDNLRRSAERASQQLDGGKVDKAGDTMTGLLVLSGDPTAALGAATKQYVDGQAGLNELRQVTRTELGADNTLTANTDTTIISQALTMPASGGPWRVMVWWHIMHNNVGVPQSRFQMWVDDQQGTTANIFADAQAINYGTTGDGKTGSGLSKQTYSNGASITLLLRIRSNQADVIKAAPVAGPTQIKTYLQTLVVKD